MAFVLALCLLSLQTLVLAAIDTDHFQRIQVNKGSYILESTSATANFYQCARTFEAASKASPMQYVFSYDWTAKTCEVGTVSTSDLGNTFPGPENIGVYFDRK